MVYEQNRVDSKDTLIKTNFFVSNNLLKRSSLDQNNRAYLSTLILVGNIRVFVKYFAQCVHCSVF